MTTPSIQTPGVSDCGGQRLADRAHAQLLAFIVEQNLAQGDRLPSELELSRLTSVSRPILREALMRLQAEGLIESRRGAGSFVRRRPADRLVQHLRPAPVQSRFDSFEIRIGVEPIAARLAAELGAEPELKAIRSAVSGRTSSCGPGGLVTGHCLELHRLIAVASQNPMFLVVLEALNANGGGPIAPPTASVGAAANLARQIENEHLAIVEAIDRREPEVAEAAMRLHLVRARARTVAMGCCSATSR